MLQVAFLFSAFLVFTASGLENVGTINGKVFFADIAGDVQVGTAETTCQINNATLGRIESEEENWFIVDYMVANNVSSFWLDATDYASEGTWRYGSTGEPLTYRRFSVWTSNSARLNCAYIWVGPDNEGYRGLWYPSTCSSPTGDGQGGKMTLCTAK